MHKKYIALLFTIVSGCNQESTPTKEAIEDKQQSTTEKITSLEITTQKFMNEINKPVSLNVMAHFEDGNVSNVTKAVTWEFSEPVPVMNKNQEIIMHNPGNLNITAKFHSMASTMKVQFYKDNYGTYSINKLKNVKTNHLESRQINISDIENLGYRNSYRFNNINIQKQDNAYYIYNRTMSPINTLHIKSKNFDTSKHLKIILNKPLPSNSKAVISSDSFSDLNVEKDIETVFQNGLFSPRIELGPNDEASTSSDFCSDINIRCTRPALGDEITALKIISTNYKNIFNSKSFLEFVNVFFNNNCSNYSDCSQYTGQLEYYLHTYMTMAIKSHNFTLKVFTNIYNANGIGVGYKPSLYKVHANDYCVYRPTRCYASVQDRFLDKSSSAYKNLSNSLYKTVIHEIAHSYDLNHQSGWAYGVSDAIPDYLENHYHLHEDLKIKTDVKQT